MPTERITIKADGRTVYTGDADIYCGWRGHVHYWDVEIDSPGIGRQISPRRDAPLQVASRQSPEVEAFVAAPVTRGPAARGARLRGTGACPLGHRG